MKLASWGLGLVSKGVGLGSGGVELLSRGVGLASGGVGGVRVTTCQA